MRSIFRGALKCISSSPVNNCSSSCFVRSFSHWSQLVISTTRLQSPTSPPAIIFRESKCFLSSSSSSSKQHERAMPPKRSSSVKAEKDATVNKAAPPPVKVEVKPEPRDDDDAVAKPALTSSSSVGKGGGIIFQPPPSWPFLFDAIRHERLVAKSMVAPVDTIGCHMLYDRAAEAKGELSANNKRYQILLSLMLSAQTRDQCTAQAMGQLIALNGCTVEAMGGLTEKVMVGGEKENKDTDAGAKAKATAKNNTSKNKPCPPTEDEIKACISCVCFYNNKAKYIRQVTDIIAAPIYTAADITNAADQSASNNTNRRKKSLLPPPGYGFGGVVPTDYDTLVAMPGLGPKMVHIFMEAALGIVSGIGVDVHVHRIAQRFGWVPSADYLVATEGGEGNKNLKSKTTLANCHKRPDQNPVLGIPLRHQQQHQQKGINSSASLSSSSPPPGFITESTTALRQRLAFNEKHFPIEKRGVKTAEDTRAVLESWLPRGYWADVNVMLVGLGQTICSAQRPKCGSCPFSHLCPNAFREGGGGGGGERISDSASPSVAEPNGIGKKSARLLSGDFEKEVEEKETIKKKKRTESHVPGTESHHPPTPPSTANVGKKRALLDMEELCKTLGSSRSRSTKKS